MVWWVNQLLESPQFCRPGASCFYKDAVDDDIIFQTTNIMINLNSETYNTDEIYSLLSSGVNIFNVDRTIHDNEFLQAVKRVITEAECFPEMYPPDYFRPITLAITMSIQEPVAIDERIDVIILRDITEVNTFLEFKKRNPNTNGKMIVLWLNTWNSVETKNIIKFSDGVILDLGAENDMDELCSYALETCKEAYKPVFYVKRDLVKDYYQTSDRDRLLYSTAAEITKSHADGVMIFDSNEEKPPQPLVRALVKAVKYFEYDIDKEKDYFEWSFRVKTPVLQPMSVAFAVSLAALKCNAQAIIVLSSTGRSARWISCATPHCHVLCITTRNSKARQMHMYRKIIPVLYTCSASSEANWRQECDNRIHFGIRFALRIGLFVSGAEIIAVTPSEEGLCSDKLMFDKADASGPYLKFGKRSSSADVT